MHRSLGKLIKIGNPVLLVAIPSLLLGCLAQPSHAQQVPLPSSPLTRPPEQLSPTPPTPPIEPVLPRSPSDPTEQTPPLTTPTQEVLIPVKQINIVGSTILSKDEINALIAPFQNRSVTFGQLQQLTDDISQIYQDRNYITSRAVLIPQEIKDGVVTIQVREAALERVEVKRIGDVLGRLNDDYVRDRVLQAGTTPLNFVKLEDALQLLRSDPLIRDIRANLTTGSQDNQSILQISFSEAKSSLISTFVDNYGNVSTGIYRAGLNLQELNTTGNGDSLMLGYTRSGSSDNYQFNYQYPINPQGGSLGFSFSTSQNPITEPPFNSLNIATDSQIYELSYRQPLWRSPREEFTISSSIAFEQSSSSFLNRSFNFQNFKFDDGRSQSRVLRIDQDYINRDQGGAWLFRSNFNIGLNTLGATIRNDGSPDGRFFYWLGQVLRVQQLGSDRDYLAFLRLNMQFSGSQLLSLNRFSIGGAQSVRGYRQGQLTGDNGIQASAELQLPVLRNSEGIPIVKMLPFLEAGTVWNSSGISSGNQSLIGIGLGATYQPIQNLLLRLDYGLPLINVGNSGTNLQDSGLYFSINANF